MDAALLLPLAGLALIDRRGPGQRALPKGIEHYRASILRKIAAIRAARDAAPPGEGDGGQPA